MEMHPPQPDPVSPESNTARAVRPLLWGLFTILVLIGGWLFLRACGTNPVLGFAGSFCPIPTDHRALGREVETGERLRRAIHLAELRVAETPACAAPAPAPAPVEQPRQTIQIDKQVEERGGKRGTLQFTLIWQTRDDLDLSVSCPGGVISSFDQHRGPGICGDGVKDLDANRNAAGSATTNPVENITFPTAPPAGVYTIEIIEFRAFTQDADNVVPFTLRIRSSDQEKICNSTVTWMDRRSNQRDAVGLMGGLYRTISWTLGEPLPDCTFETKKAYRGGLVK